MSDRMLQIRQVSQYPRSEAVEAGYVALLQAGEAGTPYVSILARDLVATALAGGGRLQLDADTGAIQFGPPNIFLNAVSGVFTFSAPVNAPAVSAAFIDAPSITVAGVPVVTQAQLAADRAASVTSFNLRTGDIMLMPEDILRAGGAPIRDAHFGGWITAPSVWDTRANDDTVATTNWVHRAIHETGVSSFNGRTGCVTLTTADISAATAAGPGYPTAPSPPLGDASNRIATTLFVDESLQDLHLTISDEQLALLTSTYAPINSPQFTGIPTAPTAGPGTHTGQLATTAFVMNAVTASTTGVSSFNTRTGAVTLAAADISGASGALLNSPAFVGAPTAPTPAPGTSSTVLATTAFVAAAITAAGGVTSFNTRTGAVSLTLSDVTGTNVLNNTALAGVPTAPTAAPGTSSTQVATTAFVAAALAGGVTSFMSRTGAVTLTAADVSSAGGALNVSPVFTGTPTAPTAAPGTNTTQLATTQFVTAALAAGGGVTTFNGRAGSVTLTAADVTGVGGALLASPTFTGTPAAPTATAGTNSTQIATTAFVQAALAAGGGTPGWTFALPGGVSTQTATGTATVLNLGIAPGTQTWNPSDNNAMTLSNSNLTATFPTSGSAAVRGTSGLSSGKVYFEATMTTFTTSDIGVATAGAALSYNAAGQAIVTKAGDVWVNAGLAGPNIGLMSSGAGIGVAVDLGARLIWFRTLPAGNWNGSGTANPATGAGGVSISALTGTLFPIFGSNANGDSVTANFGNSSYAGTVPSGFSSFISPATVNYKINNNSNGSIVQIQDNSLSSSSPANALMFRNNISGQPSIISTVGSDTNRGIQLVPNGTGTVQAPTMAPGDNSTAIATTAFVAAAGGIKSVKIQKFTTAGAFTYTPSAGMVYCIVEAVGGGGGSGASNAATGAVISGGAGGGGAYARKLLTAAQVGVSLSGSVGAGGAAALSGGDTSLAALVIAKGGGGGGGGTAGANGPPGAGGSAASSTGDVTLAGGSGQWGPFASAIGSTSLFYTAGAGGSSMFAAATQGNQAVNGAAANSVAGIAYGGGASGSATNNENTTAGNAAAGGSGIVIITEFCSQ